MFTDNFNSLLRLVRGFLALVLVFIVAKCLFVACYPAVYGPLGGIDALPAVIAHGLAMDCSMSAYLCGLPALLFLVGIWVRWQKFALILRVYTVIISIIISAALIADVALYGYWHFKLDTTALFYLSTSPSAAMASVDWWMPLAGLVAVGLLAWGIFSLLWRMWRPRSADATICRRRGAATTLMVIAIAAMVIAIRGGLTVSTMNLSSAYFSHHAELNHAAVNPLFSFMYSATHQSRFSDQFRFFDENGATGRYLSLLTPDAAMTDTTATAMRPQLATQRPDIYLIILESFSSYLMPSLGGDSVATSLDSIAGTGILFTDFYASSFRTDRSLPAILSGYPAQPTTSIMKYADKTDHLPSLPRTLRDNGYELEYYYGGDANFTNMKAFLVSAGFGTIISDVDFPVSERLSKWGVHDDRLFTFAADRFTSRPDSLAPLFAVIQTSSSHEPFEVPYNSGFDDPRLNAFAYTDHWLGRFTDTLRADSARWARSLVLMVPDHWAVWPDGTEPGPDRHRIPLVMTGGAISSPLPARIPLIASQTDIAATLLAMLGINSGNMTFSHDIFDPTVPRHAWFSEPDVAGIVTPQATSVISIATGETLSGPEELASQVRAYLQTLYSDLDNR
ncbi:MAG: LTA synthase family protein [Bacteroides sp.]|nr:LTA synthase family protein [Bacteroides sp.]MBD5308626.1 LTA synthase family protein [Bacteroides sp.]